MIEILEKIGRLGSRKQKQSWERAEARDTSIYDVYFTLLRNLRICDLGQDLVSAVWGHVPQGAVKIEGCSAALRGNGVDGTSPRG